jgi:hypothetical protein
MEGLAGYCSTDSNEAFFELQVTTLHRRHAQCVASLGPVFDATGTISLDDVVVCTVVQPATINTKYSGYILCFQNFQLSQAGTNLPSPWSSHENVLGFAFPPVLISGDSILELFV